VSDLKLLVCCVFVLTCDTTYLMKFPLSVLMICPLQRMSVQFFQRFGRIFSGWVKSSLNCLLKYIKDPYFLTGFISTMKFSCGHPLQSIMANEGCQIAVRKQYHEIGQKIIAVLAILIAAAYGGSDSASNDPSGNPATSNTPANDEKAKIVSGGWKDALIGQNLSALSSTQRWYINVETVTN
jgi:hypothetical protein